MYDRDKPMNFMRYGIMAEHVDYLLNFTKAASCEVIVRNPFVDAATDFVDIRRDIDRVNVQDDHLKNKSSITPTENQHQSVIITATEKNPIQQQICPPKIRPPRATCNFCNKSFGHLGDYNKHLRRHTGERPYSCDSCPRRFAHTSNLQRHRRLHSGEKPFECPTCDKKFGRKDKLAAHVARRCCKASNM